MTDAERRIKELKRDIKKLRKMLKDGGLNRSTLHNVRFNAQEQVRRSNMALELSNEENELEELESLDVSKAQSEIKAVRIKIEVTEKGVVKIRYPFASYKPTSYERQLIYKEIKKDENMINALLYLIKIDFSLISKTFSENSDYTLIFIDLIKNYSLPISESFKIILRKIHEGEIPEEELLKITTPSEDFNKYLKNLLLNNFKYKYDYNKLEETNSERNFRIILRDIESKISIIFFIGLFFPIGLCFLILFHQIDYITMILFIPFFLIFINFLFKKFIKIDIMLIGLLNEYSYIQSFHKLISKDFLKWVLTLK